MAQPVKRREMAVLALASLALSLVTALAALGPRGLMDFGANFDGHFYIDIARSFPLPYSAEGRDYLGQAPGFPALLYLARLLTPDVLHWGALALVCTWLTSITSVLAFYLLCREVEVPAFPASLSFLVVNPTWALVSSAAHVEPLAVTCALLCFTAHLRGSLPWSVVWLSLALLTRFPAVLLGGALAFDLLVVRRQLSVRSLAWLSLPLVVFGLHNAYLFWRVPGFTGIWDVHQVHWVTHWTWPFAEMLAQWSPMADSGMFLRPLVYGSAAVYLIATVVGLRPSERGHWWLALWVGAILLLHVSLSGAPGVQSFRRLVVLAWPATVLIAWRCVPSGSAPRLPAFVAACIALSSFSVHASLQQIRAAVYVQSLTLWMNPKLAQLGDDEPRWVDFKEIKDLDRVRLQERLKRERMRAAQGTETLSPESRPVR
jgi:hypothetical protein